VQKSTIFELNLDVLSVELKTRSMRRSTSRRRRDRDPPAARDPSLFKKVVSSISPTIYGYDREKEAIALQLFGGVHKASMMAPRYADITSCWWRSRCR